LLKALMDKVIVVHSNGIKDGRVLGRHLVDVRLQLGNVEVLVGKLFEELLASRRNRTLRQSRTNGTLDRGTDGALDGSRHETLISCRTVGQEKLVVVNRVLHADRRYCL
jgi:hypothetical protein